MLRLRAPFERAFRDALASKDKYTWPAELLSKWNTRIVLVGRRGADVVALGSGYLGKILPDGSGEVVEVPVSEYRDSTWLAPAAHMEQIRRENPLVTQADWDSAASRLVELDATAAPDLTGGVPSILRIEGPGRATWVKRGECPRLEPILLP